MAWSAGLAREHNWTTHESTKNQEMQIIVPIYVREKRGRGTAAPISARPLFFNGPKASGSELGRVIATLQNKKLRVGLNELTRNNQHDELLSWHHPDEVNDKVIKLNLDLRDGTANLRVMLVTVRRHGRMFAFSPSLPDLWFDVEPGESVEDRAQEVYESHFRARRKENPDYPIERHSIEGRAWVDYLAIDILRQRQSKPKPDPLRALLGGDDVSDGAAQLRQVGRCLNWLDTSELTQPIGVDDDVRRLCQLLEVGDRRGVVLVGPSGSGKSARVEGAVRRRASRQKANTHGLIWQLSPARLISGMSYLGQWQERVLSILRHAYHFDHVLYFEDMLGLFEAGKTRDSAMCVADTLRAQLDVRPVRILAEMTNEAWSIFRERDRTLADRFVVLPTSALDKEKSMDILIGVRRRLEDRHRCRFDTDVLPEVVSMYDRFERTSVLPGKAAAALSRLAAKSKSKQVTRQDAILEFQSRSGLRPSIIDRRILINRESVTERIRQQVVGQDEPVNQLVQRVLVAAARLNDTSRPLGTYLLVGPTGVGKTQLAKAVANCLFDEGGLIRVDMNELSSPASAARLVGTFDAPDGLLTSAVRRRPHAVLLLDEIEKAHPAVLDVLLQAIGEARLSDARGRTVDLSGLLILMTSNLGTRESGRGRGFASGDNGQAIAAAHERAIREFFRPEFFNRIDGVLSFARLSPETMQSIAWMQFNEILKRDGLQRRSVLIDVDEAAIRQTAARGYDPAMGARALKRQIERDLVRPAAEVLAASSSEQPTLLRLYLEQGEVKTHWETLKFAERSFEIQQLSIEEFCEQAEKFLELIAAEKEDHTLSFEIGEQGLDPQLLENMTLRDSLLDCQNHLRQLRDAMDQPKMQRPQSTPVHIPHPGQATGMARYDPKLRTSLKDLQAIDDIQDYLSESLVMLAPGELDVQRDVLVDKLGRLHHQFQARGSASRWIIWLRFYGEDSQRSGFTDSIVSVRTRHTLASAITRWITQEEDLVIEEDQPSENLWGQVVSGALAFATVQQIQGSWMFVKDGRIEVADVRIRAVDESESLTDQFEQWEQQESRRPLEPVRRLIQADGPLVDLQTGAVVNAASNTSGLVKLLTMSRRNIDFLIQDHEVPS